MKHLNLSFNLNPQEKHLVKRALGLLAVFTLVLMAAGLTSLFFTRRHQTMIVPRVIGMEPGQAARTLSFKGLRLEVGRSQYDDHTPEGLILIQNPKPNDYLQRGMTVTAVLSKGSPQVKVPIVVGLSFAEAQIALAGSRLRSNRESRIFSSYTPKDIVIAQVPNAGLPVESFTGVNLLVSNGPMEPSFVMPYLKNHPFEEVFKILRPMGITIEKIKNEVRDDLEAGTVLSQSPPPGSKIREKARVSFVVSMKSSDENLTARHADIVFDVPDTNPKRLQIDVFDSSGTRTVYNKMASSLEHVEVGVNVTGKASALIYLNQEFVKEMPIP